MADVYNPELKPCPFCGSPAKLCSSKANAAGARFVFWVHCNFRGDLNCDVIPTTPKFDTAEQAVNAWNMRFTTAMQNTVDHPSYYQKANRRECICEMEEQFGTLAVFWFCKLNAYKYRYRAGCKDGNSAEQDEAKALWYDAKADEMQEKYNDQFICRAIDEKFRRHENVPNDYRTGKEVAEQLLERGKGTE